MTDGNIIPPKAQMVMARDFVVRRSELTVPGHSIKMMAKAATSNADQVMFKSKHAKRLSRHSIRWTSRVKFALSVPTISALVTSIAI